MPRDVMMGAGHRKGCTPNGECCMERWVWAPQYRCAGTATSPIESVSMRVSAMTAPCDQPATVWAAGGDFCAHACAASSMRLAKPHSLSNHRNRLANPPPFVRVWLPSMMTELALWLKSTDAWG